MVLLHRQQQQYVPWLEGACCKLHLHMSCVGAVWCLKSAFLVSIRSERHALTTND
jgi:hypothetical protein